jgi:peroxiredoxin
MRTLMDKWIVGLGLFLVCLPCPASTMATMAAPASDEVAGWIPQRLLPVIHSEQGQAALNLSAADLEWLETELRAVDGLWWRSRLLPDAEQRRVVAELEQQLRQRLQSRLSAEQMTRLQQIEWQAQGTRALLRSDLAEQLALTTPQLSQLKALVAATQAKHTAWQAAMPAGTPPKADAEALKSEWLELQQQEPAAALKVLSAEQQNSLQRLVGPTVALAEAQRIFPLAPDFAADAHWLSDSPGQLMDLRGKVLIVHFYAYQCINCQRNFAHYNDWRERWSNDQVVVVGIQTPETRLERDAAQVQAASKKDGFQFPVLMDSDNSHWNAWGTTMWPTVYIVDQRGYIRMWWQGELNWQGATGDQQIVELVDRLLQK